MSTTAPQGAPPPEQAKPTKHRNWWIWVSAVLALAAVGLLIWGLSTKSDLDSAKDELAGTNQKLDSTTQELDTTKQKLDSTTKQLDTANQDVADLQSAQADQGKGKAGKALLGVGAVAGIKAVYDDLAGQLGASQEDLAATQKELEDANAKAAQAEQDAAAAADKAKKADNETDKAKAETEQAQAEAQAAESKATAVTDCAKAYVTAFGGLFEGDGPTEQAPAVRDDIEKVTADCKTALGGG